MTTLLFQLDPSFQSFVEDSGTDKALYGCVKAAALWYNNLYGTITKDGSVKMHKRCTDGNQTIDDLLVTNAKKSNLDAFYRYLKDFRSVP